MGRPVSHWRRHFRTCRIICAPSATTARSTPFCLKQSALADDLSLVPNLTPPEKQALRGFGLVTTEDVFRLKDAVDPRDGRELTAGTGARKS